MSYTDDQLKRVLVKILPEELQIRDDEVLGNHVCWKSNPFMHSVLDTELLEVCRRIEQGCSEDERLQILREMADNEYRGGGYFSTWQQRTVRLAQVKGIAIPTD
jgi:hypothetical protein